MFSIHAFQEGGWPMFPILGVMLVSWAIGLERAFALYLAVRENKHALLSGIQKRIIKAGLLKVNKTDKEVQAALDEASLREVPYIEKRTGHLAVLANAATLIGLFGTILGMIHCFGGVANADPAMKAIILSKGISEAMNCTAFGLISAIVALMSMAVLNGKTQGLLDDINAATVQVMNLVVNNRSKVNLQGLPAEGGA